MTVTDWDKVHECCKNIINKWYYTHGVHDRPRDWEDKVEDATWYVFYLLERKGETIADLRCKLVTYCYLPCINVMLNKQAQYREKTERYYEEIFEGAATYDTFEDDLLDALEEQGY